MAVLRILAPFRGLRCSS